MSEDIAETELNAQLTGVFIDVLRCLGTVGQQIGARYGLNGSDAMALHKIDHPMTMKELAQNLGCDASFITSIADSLEKRGLARREPSQRDRRSKNLVLTEHGLATRDQVVRETAEQMPWGNALSVDERKSLLGMLRKMVRCARTGTSEEVQGGAAVTTGAVTSS